MILILLTVLIVSSCKTQTEYITIEKPDPPLPLEPVLEQPLFVNQEGGLFLAYSEYRKLERNLIRQREYRKKLLEIISYYRGEECQTEKNAVE